MSLLLGLPAWAVTTMIIAAMVVVSIVCHAVLTRRTLPGAAHDNEIVGFLLQIVGLMYAVLLAFVVVAAWEDLDRARQTAQREVDALGDLYRIVSAYPPATRDRVRNDILAYARLMQIEEFPAMQRGQEGPRTFARAERIAEVVDRFRARTLADGSVESESLALLHEFLDARRQRLNTNQRGMPRVLWWTLWIGAALTIGFSFMLQATNRRRQFAMTALLAATIGLLLSLAIEFEYPFRGEVSVPLTGWERLEKTLTSGLIR